MIYGIHLVASKGYFCAPEMSKKGYFQTLLEFTCPTLSDPHIGF